MLGASTRNYLHFLQMFEHGEPAHYDFGTDNNQTYGDEHPPPYRMGNVNSSHIALIYTRNDWFLQLEDVHLLKQSLQGIFLVVVLLCINFNALPLCSQAT
jgi:hypothetical protein